MRLSPAIQLTLAFLLAGAVGAAETKTARHLGSFTWQLDADWFGGFSALDLSEDGQSMTVLSDRATLATARIRRTEGVITGIDAVRPYPVLSSRGRRLVRWAGDSEGLAIAPDGSIFISFEGVHRVARYQAPGALAKVLPRPEAFEQLDPNGSFEALAMDPLGRLYTLTERSRTSDGQIPVFRWDGSAWTTPFTLPPRGGFRPVGADFGPDGRFYLLERAVVVIGFRSRLRRWEITDDLPHAEETLFETNIGAHDNLEGLSVWRDGQGRLRATMISDDNFLPLQRTELVEYVLPD